MNLVNIPVLRGDQVNIRTLYPITEENVNRFINELGYAYLESYEAILEILEDSGLPIQHFYLTEDQLSVVVYCVLDLECIEGLNK